jgi:hypothetical protein
MITSFRSIRRLRERCVDDGRRSARDDGAERGVGRRAGEGTRVVGLTRCVTNGVVCSRCVVFSRPDATRAKEAAARLND